jgi:hypothetical protein
LFEDDILAMVEDELGRVRGRAGVVRAGYSGAACMQGRIELREADAREGSGARDERRGNRGWGGGRRRGGELEGGAQEDGTKATAAAWTRLRRRGCPGRMAQTVERAGPRDAAAAPVRSRVEAEVLERG